MQHAPQKSRPKVMVMMSVWVALPPPHKHPKPTMHQDLESAQTLDWGTGSGSGCGTAQASKGMLMYWHSGEPSAYSELDSAHVTTELMARCTLVNAIGNQARSKNPHAQDTGISTSNSLIICVNALPGSPGNKPALLTLLSARPVCGR